MLRRFLLENTLITCVTEKSQLVGLPEAHDQDVARNLGSAPRTFLQHCGA